MIVLRLLRFPNLVVVALTQWLVAQQILGKAYEQEGLVAVLNTEELLLIIFATVCLTAAGYVINDLLDYPIDMINRPERVLVGQKIGEGTVRWLVASLVFTGFFSSLLLAFLKQELAWLWLFPCFAVLLGIYPRALKTRPFAGNIFIAFCCAGTAGLIWLAERSTWRLLSQSKMDQISFIILLFMGYAFLATWIREIIKDFEDLYGDIRLGRNTLPAYLGIAQAKRFVSALSLVLIITLCVGLIPWSYSLFQPITAVVSGCLMIGVLILLKKMHQARQPEHYYNLSQQWKFFLLGGLLLLFLYKI
ncbi:geranylgeranylglycerol-phosphate geranylgeranyltransferase [Lewinella cohaerens]|uniref:geranylgeranylglycerol-phosphate geranylgeranyltransferase n=1 Tax=Lewinella cohaerens TaxID=70995 RepID=UPI00036E26AB|nr:geranylgeranylglycerol-phosphate geranylgeranyltransferase [Lewinella cohaerens]